MSTTVPALYIGGPFHGTITEIPVDARRQQHVESLDKPLSFSYGAGGDAWDAAPIKTQLTTYVLRDDLFNDTVLCPAGWEEFECMEAHDRWREGLLA